MVDVNCRLRQLSVLAVGTGLSEDELSPKMLDHISPGRLVCAVDVEKVDVVLDRSTEPKVQLPYQAPEQDAPVARRLRSALDVFNRGPVATPFSPSPFHF